jgi:hypothetical protein
MGGKGNHIAQTHVVANPYSQNRTVSYGPGKVHCETCDRTIHRKDWPAHERSKKHAEAKLMAAKTEAAKADASAAKDRTAEWADQQNDNGDGSSWADGAADSGDWASGGTDAFAAENTGGEWAADAGDANSASSDNNGWGDSGGAAHNGFGSAPQRGGPRNGDGYGGASGRGGGGDNNGCFKCGECEFCPPNSAHNAFINISYSRPLLS